MAGQGLKFCDGGPQRPAADYAPNPEPSHLSVKKCGVLGGLEAWVVESRRSGGRMQAEMRACPGD